MRTSVSLYHRHRFPSEIISHCVWLYFRFALSFRDVEEMLAMRGVTLSYETVREWCLSSARFTPTAYVTNLHALVTYGRTLM
jgi:transposase-like protein